MQRPDIAIADLTNIWEGLSSRRNAAAIDLHSWVEPDWSVTQPVWMAYGFPEGHKSRAGNEVAAPMPRVAAELVSSFPSLDKPDYTLCSTLMLEHGWGFSGISGEPVLVAHIKEDRYAYVGITFEGGPSTMLPEENSESFLNGRDIVLKG